MSGELWTSEELATICNGRLTQEGWAANSVSIDSRTMEDGALFVALKGDNFDGHDFVKAALEGGASAALVDHVPEDVEDNAALIVVDNTFIALQEIGRAARHRSKAKIIAVTGSVGKTGTKEMLAAAFGALGKTHASKSSHNNHLGVPLSLANMAVDTEYGIFEIGMNHAGEIAALTQQVKPDIAIITTIEPVHIENFDSVEGIALAKAEIFESMDASGVAILNRDNNHFGALAAQAKTFGVRSIYGFGESGESDIRLTGCILAANGTRVEADVMGESVAFTLQIAGQHIAMNALSVLGAVKAAGGTVSLAAKALERVAPVSGRGNREAVHIGDPKNPVTLIDESYNASPTSMTAAFRVLAMIDPGHGGRRVAILGDMLELGADGPQLHAGLSLPARMANIDLVYTCGPLMKNLHEALPANQRGAHKDNSKDMATIVPDVMIPGDVVMVKGSNGSKMSVVVEAVRDLSKNVKTKKGVSEDAL